MTARRERTLDGVLSAAAVLMAVNVRLGAAGRAGNRKMYRNRPVEPTHERL
jgi:hypothetical protein